MEQNDNSKTDSSTENVSEVHSESETPATESETPTV